MTPEGFPLAYDVIAGNTSDKTTLRAFLSRIEAAVWQGAADLGDGSRHSDRRGVRQDAATDPPVRLSGGHPRGAARPAGKDLSARRRQQARPGRRGEAAAAGRRPLRVRPEPGRVAKERAMRKRQLKGLWTRLTNCRDGAHPRESADEARRRPRPGARPHGGSSSGSTPTPPLSLPRSIAKNCVRRAAARAAICCAAILDAGHDPAELWQHYILLVEVDIDQTWRLCRDVRVGGFAALGEAGRSEGRPGAGALRSAIVRRPRSRAC